MSRTQADDAPRLDVEETGDEARLVAGGAWLISSGKAAERLVDAVDLGQKRRVVMDLSKVTALDTAGSWLLHRLRATLEFGGARVDLTGLPENRRTLIAEVESHVPEPWAPRRMPWSWTRIPELVGRRSVMVGEDVVAVLNVLGAFALGLVACLVHPSRMRWNSILYHLDTTGRGAVPIMVLMSTLIGAIIAQQGAFYLRRFGADVFVVDLVGVLALREIGVLLTAIMFAGRSGSAFTAEIGSMKMREEIDALTVMGVRPLEVLIIPRLIALMLALPALTFISDMAALFGAMVVSISYVGLSPDAFMIQLLDAIDLETFMVGIVKAPFMALIIGLVACVEGLKVEGSAESLGRQTTVSVVKAIFMVIVVDGVFAVFFATVGI
jgi:phospholipid/cholesterol/gamma-HCH transport system permease protein